MAAAAPHPEPHAHTHTHTDASLPSSPDTPETHNRAPSLDSYPSAYSLSSTVNCAASVVETGVGSPDEKADRLALGEAPTVLVVSDEGEPGEGEADIEEEEYGGREKKGYDPPRKPLTPHQLRRIAGTFGIIIPDMPDYSFSLPLSTPSSPTPSHSTRSPTSMSTTTPIGMASGAAPVTSRTPGRLSPRGTPHQVRSTGYLLAVIPPLLLLPPSSSPATPIQQRQREKKWRRGTLLPLQPTLGSMLVCIAREWNLPSTVGISVYLVMPPVAGSGGTPGVSPRLGYDDSASAAGSIASAYEDEDEGEREEEEGEEEEQDGPRISAATWSTLFTPHLLQSSSTAPSRTGTPSQAPAAVRGTSGGVPFPLISPTLRQGSAMASQQQQQLRSLSLGPLAARSGGKRHRSHPSTSSTAASASSRSHRHTPSSGSSASPTPPTPASVASSSFLSPIRSPNPNPIVGSIEFDIDLDEAAWFESWKRAGGGRRYKRVIGSGEGGGVRELGLVKKMGEGGGDGRPRFLKEMEKEAETETEAEVAKAAKGAKARDGAEVGQEQNVIVTLPEDDPLSPSPGPSESATTDPEVVEVARLLDAQGVRREDLLASPIQLGGFNEQSPVARRVQQVLEKRWSGLVMSEQLDDLEKIMRQLSPREIRLTSPRHMTPRMAEKVANQSHDLLPEVPRHGAPGGALVPLSPLAAGSTTPGKDESQEREAVVEGVKSEVKRIEPREEQVKAAEKVDGDLPPPQRAWQEIPYRSPSSPSGAPKSLASPISPLNHQFFNRPSYPQRNASSPSSLSSETMQRIQADAQAQQARGSGGAGTEWVPRRPARPPSPKLEHQGTLSHTMSSDLVDLLSKSPTAPAFAGLAGAGASPTARAFGSPKYEVQSGVGTGMGVGVVSPREEERQRKASGISLKTLRHQMSAKNLKWGSGKELAAQGQGLGMGMGSPTEFGGMLLDDHLAESPAAGAQDTGDRPSASMPSRSGKFASRILHPTFGFKKHDGAKDGTAWSSGSPAGRQRRNPSMDSHIPIQISSPIMGSLTHSRSGSGSLALPDNATLPAPPLPGRPSMQDHARSGSHPVSNSSKQPRAPLPGSKSAAHLAPLASYPTLPVSQSHASNLGTHGHGGYGAYPQPGSPGMPASPGTPASPKSVRRKPVPGMEPAASGSAGAGAGAGIGAGAGGNGVGLGVDMPGEDARKSSLSLGSLASFVLEDPPKGRRGAGAVTAAGAV